MAINSSTHPIIAVVTLLAAGALSGACAEHVEAREVLVPTTSATIEVVPTVEHIRAAPEILYEGHPVFWFHDHWYFQSGGQWTYYVNEPLALRPHRYVVRY
jgi:hypothetical protein